MKMVKRKKSIKKTSIFIAVVLFGNLTTFQSAIALTTNTVQNAKIVNTSIKAYANYTLSNRISSKRVTGIKLESLSIELEKACKVTDKRCTISNYLSLTNDIERNNYLTSSITKIIKSLGIKTAIFELDRIFAATMNLNNNCENILEKVALNLDYQNKISILNFKPRICYSYLQTGVIESLIGKISQKNIITYASNLCTGDPNYNSCADSPGKIAYLAKLNAHDAQEICLATAKNQPSSNQYALGGCILGYINWSKKDPRWNQYKNINTVNILCKGSTGESYNFCLGDAYRTYVRFGLTNNTAKKRLKEMITYCHQSRKLYDICSQYIGFSIVDVLDANGDGKSNEISTYLEKGCLSDDQRSLCILSFVSWYLNHLALGNPKLFHPEKTKAVCNLLTKIEKNICINQLSSEIIRYQDRIARGKKEK